MTEWGDEVVTCNFEEFKRDAGDLLPHGFGRDTPNAQDTKILVIAADAVAAKHGYSFMQVLLPSHSPAVLVFRKIKTT